MSKSQCESNWNAELYLSEVSTVYAESRKHGHTRLHGEIERFLDAARKCIEPHQLTDCLPADVVARLRSFAHAKFKRPRVLQLLKHFGACGLHEQTLRALEEPCELVGDDLEIYRRWKALGNPSCLSNFCRLIKRAREIGRVHDLATVDLPHAGRICLVQGQIVQGRVDLLMAARCALARSVLVNYTQELARAHKTASRLAQKIRLSKQARWQAMVSYVELTATIGDVGTCIQGSAGSYADMLQKIRAVETWGCHSHLLAVVAEQASELGKPELGIFLRQHIHPSITHKTVQTRAMALSEWHKAVFQELERRERSKLRIAHVDRHLTFRMRQVAVLLLGLEKYVKGLTATATTATTATPTATPTTTTMTTPTTLPLQSYLRHVTVDELRKAVCYVVQQSRACNERVKTHRATHHAKTHVQHYLHILGGMKSHIGCDLTLLTAKSVLAHIPNQRVAADVNHRRVYSQTEMDSMRKATINPFEALLFALLEELALRNSALGHLQYKTLLTPDHTPRSECRVLEKGRTTRTMILSANIQSKVKAVSDFLRQKLSQDQDQLQNAFILNYPRLRTPFALSSIADTVHRIAKRAGIKDITVHPHAFRHTLVTALVNAGNSMDVVSKFMGHTDTQATYFYWQPTAQDICRDLINPFSAEYHKRRREEGESQALLEVANKKIRACRAIIDLFQEESDAGTLARVHERAPVLEELINTIDSPLGVAKPDI